MAQRDMVESHAFGHNIDYDYDFSFDLRSNNAVSELGEFHGFNDDSERIRLSAFRPPNNIYKLSEFGPRYSFALQSAPQQQYLPHWLQEKWKTAPPRHLSREHNCSVPNDSLLGHFDPSVIPSGTEVTENADMTHVDASRELTVAMGSRTRRFLDLHVGSEIELRSIAAYSRHTLSTYSPSASIDPCFGLRRGPHQPPKPLEGTNRAPKILSNQSDRFGRYMEERMIQFRPSDSQNNVEASLNHHHPYQLAAEPLRPAPRVEAHAPPPEPVNNSTSSFLPRNRTCSAEPEPRSIAYTPRAVPHEAKDSAQPSSRPSLCTCMLWST